MNNKEKLFRAYCTLAAMAAMIAFAALHMPLLMWAFAIVYAARVMRSWVEAVCSNM